MAAAQRTGRGREGLGDRPAQRPGYTVANVCWWYAMGADGLDRDAAPDLPRRRPQGARLLHRPPALHDELTGALASSRSSVLGAAAGIASTRWIVGAAAARHAAHRPRPDAGLRAAPRLRPAAVRPDAPRPTARPPSSTRRWRRCSTTRSAGATVVVLSEYGIRTVDRPVDMNRVLRREGLLRGVHPGRMEYLDPWTSRAFAVADHQVAHVYVGDPADLAAGRRAVAEPARGRRGARRGRPGRARPGPRAVGRAGRWSPSPDAWFTYYYWLDDDRAPDFARVRGDPPQARLRPGGAASSTRPAALAKAGPGSRWRARSSACATDERRVGLDPARGARHARPAAPSEADTPLLLCSDAAMPFWDDAGDVVPAARVRDLVLQAAGVGRVRQGRRDDGRVVTTTLPSRSRRWCCSTRRVRRSGRWTRPGCTASTPRWTSRSPATASTAAGGCC